MTTNLLSYIEENCRTEIRKRVLAFLRRNRKALFDIGPNERNYRISIKKLKFSKFRARIGSDDTVDSDVILSVLPMVTFSHFGEEKTYHYKTQELRLNAKITIDKTISVELGRLSFFHGRFKGKPYDENLMLHINKEEYQKYADSMIDHYGVERDRDGKINAFELAMKMDLDIETGAFDRNHSILGAMVFEEKVLRLYDGSSRKWNDKHVRANTIIVDSEIADKTSPGAFSLTVFHECIHFHYHKMAFRLWRIFNRESIYYEKKGSEKTLKDNLLRWMEIQANGIALILWFRMMFSKHM